MSDAYKTMIEALVEDSHGAYVEKRAYNDKRADHKPENRIAADGKKF